MPPATERLDGQEFLWRIADPDPETVARIARECRVDPVVAALLVNRGFAQADAARRYLNPRLDDLHDPFLLPDVDRAVERLAAAIAGGERIFVHGDYDADGVTSAALCQRALLALGADVVGYVPRRQDGYDLQIAGVERAREAGARLILTSDCGVCAVEPVAHANALGIDVVITDHHRPGETLPDAVAVVNPYRAGFDPPFRDLCGAGVAFKVLDALVARIRPDHRDAFRRNFVDLAAVGTVADVTSLRDENRILVAHGLERLADGKKTGIRALLMSVGLGNGPVRSDDIGFKIAPALNAAGRMDDADLAFRLLTTRDAEEAEELVARLQELNARRKEETERIQLEASVDALLPENEGRRVLVLARDRWGKGLLGPAATRIAEAFRRPTIVLAYDAHEDAYHGSGRAWGDFNLLEALNACADLLGRFGGHQASAGLSVPAKNLDAFRERIHAAAEGMVPDVPEPATLTIDAEIARGTVVNLDLLDALAPMAPFGRDNPEPVFLTRGAVLVESRRVGKDRNTANFQLRLPGASAPVKAVRFKSGDWADRHPAGTRLDIVYNARPNEWRGKVSVDLYLHDWRPSPA